MTVYGVALSAVELSLALVGLGSWIAVIGWRWFPIGLRPGHRSRSRGTGLIFYLLGSLGMAALLGLAFLMVRVPERLANLPLLQRPDQQLIALRFLWGGTMLTGILLGCWLIQSLLLRGQRGLIRPVFCGQCYRSMGKLPGRDLARQLRAAETIAHRLGSVYFEGWICPKCRGIHIRGHIQPGFRWCETCRERTMKAESRALVGAKGRVRTPICQCCGKQSGNRVTQPERMIAPK